MKRIHEMVSLILNSESANSLADIFMIYFSTGKLRKKLFWTSKKFVFFINCSNEKITWKKIWCKKLVKTSDGFVTCTSFS